MSAQQVPPGGVQIEHKKGEVNELKTSLRNPAIDRDPEKKREVIKRVIAYMTLGIDVSKLFSEMVMVSTASCSTGGENTTYRCERMLQNDSILDLVTSAGSGCKLTKIMLVHRPRTLRTMWSRRWCTFTYATMLPPIQSLLCWPSTLFRRTVVTTIQ